MGKTSALVLALLIGFMAATSIRTALSQNSKLEWSSMSSGFGLQASATSRVRASVGEGIVGGSRLANAEIESGFIPGVIFRGATSAVPGQPTGLPASFSLSQNYPNPFNPSTVIKYTVGGVGSGLSGRDSRSGGPEGRGPGVSVRLTVYDVLGREVAVLVNERQAPGSYQVTFSAKGRSGSGLASGVYIYRIQAGAFVDTKKLLLLK